MKTVMKAMNTAMKAKPAAMKAKPAAKAEVVVDEPPRKKANKDGIGQQPSFSHEQSRSQYMARSGLSGPGQSCRFPYAGAKGQKKAEASAMAFVVSACKKRGLPIPDKYKP